MLTPEYQSVVDSWLAKADSDLASAKILIEGDEPHYDTGCYHCQQSAEKSLKGWLTSRQLEFRKTHDLGELLAQCMTQDPRFQVLQEAAQFLTPFATQFRYPGDIFEPPPEASREALFYACSIVEFVRSVL